MMGRVKSTTSWKLLLGKTQTFDIFGGDVNLELLLQKLDDFSAHHRVHSQLGQRCMLTHGLDVLDAQDVGNGFDSADHTVTPIMFLCDQHAGNNRIVLLQESIQHFETTRDFLLESTTDDQFLVLLLHLGNESHLEQQQSELFSYYLVQTYVSDGAPLDRQSWKSVAFSPFTNPFHDRVGHAVVGLPGVAATARNRREDDEIPKPENHHLGSLLTTDLKCGQISRVI
jgi:hypothetical protein